MPRENIWAGLRRSVCEPRLRWRRHGWLGLTLWERLHRESPRELAPIAVEPLPQKICMNQETLGLIAGTLTTASFVPQVWKIWSTRSARDLSWAMVAVFTLGTFLWLLYGIKVESTSIMIANAITFLLSLAICVMKLRFDKEIIGDPR